MQLRLYPDPVLRQTAEDVIIGDIEARRILDEMANKMYEWRGAGLAAPQVGISKKMVVIDVMDPKVLYQMINPTIVHRSENMVDSSEGCLSVPLVTAKVSRYANVFVEYYDCSYKKCTIDASGLLSICLQHEIDHLYGILYVDKLSRYWRSCVLKKSAKLMKESTAKLESNDAETSIFNIDDTV
ncbi:MAG: peptide deformylase [Holosporaceae bacterium]|jgi:peptide deformylase|nr:peptide deformylase [Holosporaceae bacterium]